MNYGELIGFWGNGIVPKPMGKKIFEYSEIEMAAHAKGRVPEYMIPGLIGYIMDGAPPVEFARCILQNDLMGAAAAATGAEQLSGLLDWVILLHNFTPPGCHGSLENYREWVEIGGLRGLEKELQNQADTASKHYAERDKEDASAIRKRRDRSDEHPEE